MSATEGPAAAAAALREASHVTAICHENPDADTIGAAVATALIARRLGKPAEIVSVDRPAPIFGFLPLIGDVVHRPGLPPGLAVICDAASLERVGRIVIEQAAWFAEARILNVDHHVSNTGFGAVNLVDPQASATCEVLARVVPMLGLELDRQLATALLTGIVRDSQGFSSASTSGETLRTVARLVDAGAPLAQLHRTLLAELPYPTMALWGLMLGTIGQDLGGRLVHVRLTQAMLDATGTAQHDADGLAEFLATVRGADIVLLLREIGPATTRVSVRTTEKVDATAVMAPFGGGGHLRRAGGTIEDTVDAALARVLAVGAQELGLAAEGRR